MEIARAIKWLQDGDTGHVLCVECTIPLKTDFNSDEHCYGCPGAYRKVGDRTEYYREPKHVYPRG
jgi:hypothetical protein